MRLTYALFVTGILAVLLCSCTRQVQCSDWQRYYLVQVTTDVAGTYIPDTNAIITAFVKGSNFTKAVQTCDSNELMRDGVGTALFLDRCMSDVDSFDWRVQLVPSGKLIFIKDIKHYSRMAKDNKEKGFLCSNDMSMVINDSLYYLHGEEGNGSQINTYAEVLVPYRKL